MGAESHNRATTRIFTRAVLPRAKDALLNFVCCYHAGRTECLVTSNGVRTLFTAAADAQR